MVSSPISHFYSFQVSDAPTMTLAVPDGSIDIIFNCNRDNHSARVCGSTLLANKMELQQEQRYVGVRFMPGVMPDFLDLAAVELFGHGIGFDDAVTGMRNIFEQIIMNSDFRLQTDLFMQMFGSRLNCSSASLLLHIIDIILHCHGAIRI